MTDQTQLYKPYMYVVSTIQTPFPSSLEQTLQVTGEMNICYDATMLTYTVPIVPDHMTSMQGRTCKKYFQNEFEVWISYVLWWKSNLMTCRLHDKTQIQPSLRAKLTTSKLTDNVYYMYIVHVEHHQYNSQNSDNRRTCTFVHIYLKSCLSNRLFVDNSYTN